MLSLFLQYKDTILSGIIVTIQASLIAMTISMILGIVIAVFQVTGNKLLNRIGTAYVEFFRNIPLVVIVMFCYMLLPSLGIKMSGFMSGSLGLSIYSSAFIADTIKTGILAVPSGQMEAARSTGLTYLQAMRYIILPQSIKIVIPPLGNRFISLIKDSSILAMVAGMDLMYHADLIASETFQTFNVYIIVALCYLCMTMPLSYFMKYLEKKWA